MNEDQALICVPKNIRYRLKVQAAKEGISMIELLRRMLDMRESSVIIG